AAQDFFGALPEPAMGIERRRRIVHLCPRTRRSGTVPRIAPARAPRHLSQRPDPTRSIAGPADPLEPHGLVTHGPLIHGNTPTRNTLTRKRRTIYSLPKC